MDDLKKVGLVMLRLRTKLGVSQDEVAAEAEMDRGYYSQVENGKRDIGLTTLKRLAEALETEDWKILQEVSEL